MPIYEYECRKCGGHLEVLVRRDGDVPKACPTCGAKGLVKAFSSFAVASGRGSSPAECDSCPAAGATCPGGTCASGGCPMG